MQVENKISIALCTYNGAKFLPEQLASMAAQTRLPDEIVVCDDNSTDETARVVQDFAFQAAFPVRLFVNERNLGSTKNFERAISLCGCDLIFLCDQDDVWLSSKIAETAAVFDENEKIGFVFSDAELVDENLEPLGATLWQSVFSPAEQALARRGRLLEVLLKKNVVTGATLAFRSRFRDCFTPIPVEVPNMIHDAWIALVIAAASEAEFINRPTMLYRQHSSQQLGVDWRGKIAENRFAAYSKSIEFYERELERLALLPALVKNNPAFQGKFLQIEKLIEENRHRAGEILRHRRTRRDLPPNKLRRVAPVFGEILSGRYHRFSNGFFSAAKDLFENL